MENKKELVKITRSSSGYRRFRSQTTWTIDKKLKQGEVKNESTFPNDPTGNFISTFSIENKDIEHLFSQIEDLTKDWQERYINFHLLDGGSWNLTFYYSDGEIKHCSGNTKPPKYEEVIDLFFEMIDKDVVEKNKQPTEPPLW